MISRHEVFMLLSSYAVFPVLPELVADQFKPPGRKNTIPGTIFLVLASLSGLAGLVPLLRAVSEPGESSGQGMDITLNDK